MKVLQVGKVLPPPYAGIEAHVEQLIEALAPEVQCELLVSETGWKHRQGNPRPFPVYAARSLARVAATHLSPGMPLLMRQWAVRNPGEIVHIHVPNPMADVSSKLLPKNTPLVLTWHSDIVRQKRLLKLYWPILRSLMERADRIIAFTPKHIESSVQLDAVPSSKISLVPVAINPERVRITPEIEAAIGRWREKLGDRPMIATVGRHVYYKGYEYLIDAVAKLPADVQLVMVGSGPLTPAFKQQAIEQDIADRVHLCGSLPDADMVALMHTCDIFCLPSIEPSEAFGLATAEAMLCGRPCVVCELGNGVNYLNRPGVTGLTVPPRNVEALADALGTLLRDDALRLQMGRAAFEWVSSEFSLERMKSGTLTVYNEVK